MCKCLSVLVLPVVLLAAPSAQEPPAPVPLTGTELAELRKQISGKPTGATEWRVTLPASAKRGAPATLPAPAQRALAAPVARDRDPQLAPDRLLVMAVDRAGKTIDLRIVADPRVVRAETADSTGLLSGTVLTYPEAELRFATAASADIHELRIYQPRWTGDGWVLDPIAASRVR